MELKLAEAVEILERTPETLSALLGGLTEGWLGAAEGPGTYGSRDVLGHLIHGEETDWIPRARIILAHGESRPFVPFDRDGFRASIRGRVTADLLREFETKRRANLAILRDLKLVPEQLELRGTHPELGTVTLGQLIAAWAVHDLGHLAQIARVMARRYADLIGPWRAYMTIVRRD